MQRAFFILFIYFLPLKGFSQLADSVIVKKIAEEILTHSPAYDHLRILCKKVGPRLSGSENYLKAVELSSDFLRQAGADTVYLQECLVPHWERGKQESGEIILKNGKKRSLNLLALGNSIGSGPKGVRAEVVEVKNWAELEAKGFSLKGKIVFLNFKMDPRVIYTFEAYGQSAGSRSRGPSRAAGYGAIGALVRTLNPNLNDIPNTGGTFYIDSLPKIPAVAISTNDAEFLSAELKNNHVKAVRFITHSRMLPDAQGYNVIGEVKGTHYPDEIITVGAHLDSWDIGEGAHDDGAGVMQSIEVLRTFMALGIKPKRTIRVVLFANEENGTRGAKAYLSGAQEKKENHLFALESDAGGFTPRSFGFDTDPEKLVRLKRWLPLFQPYGISEFLGHGGGVDIDPLKQIGTTVAGFNPDSQRYFDIHHNKNDVFENVSERELKLGAVNMTALIYLVSEYGL